LTINVVDDRGKKQPRANRPAEAACGAGGDHAPSILDIVILYRFASCGITENEGFVGLDAPGTAD
jgi:hypothetical protein